MLALHWKYLLVSPSLKQQSYIIPPGLHCCIAWPQALARGRQSGDRTNRSLQLHVGTEGLL